MQGRDLTPKASPPTCKFMLARVHQTHTDTTKQSLCFLKRPLTLYRGHSCVTISDFILGKMSFCGQLPYHPGICKAVPCSGGTHQRHFKMDRRKQFAFYSLLFLRQSFSV